jgi:hypothetical protein
MADRMRFSPQQVADAGNPRPTDSALRLELGDQLLGRELREAITHNNQLGLETCG